jgi:hypothetical protein
MTVIFLANALEEWAQSGFPLPLFVIPAQAGIDLSMLQEKRIKKYRLAWGMELIERMSTDWFDLFEQIVCRSLELAGFAAFPCL